MGYQRRVHGDFSSDFHRRKESLMTIMKTAAALILLATIAHAQPAPKESPTWFIPSGPKPAGQDDQSFCSAELELSTEQYQTRTSEIILPEELEPAVCIIFPFAPNTLRYGAGTKGECHNGCCMFRPPSKNIPAPPPSPSWYETSTGSCEDSSSAVTKPVIINGENEEEHTICVANESGVYSPVQGKTLACARQCCLFFSKDQQ